MKRAFKAELSRLIDKRSLLIIGIIIAICAVGGAAIVLSSAKPAAQSSPNSFVPSIESLSAAGGGTQVFRFVAAFGGTMVFIVFTGLFSLEYGRGTYRTMLLRQPSRLALLSGKFAGLIAYAAACVALLEATTWLAAIAESPAFDFDASPWWSLSALGSAVGDYSMVMLWLLGYASFGMMVAVVIRSAAPAIAVAVAWAGPFEHLVDNAWTGAREYLPGLLMEAVGTGGVGNVTATRAAIGATVYVLLFAAVTATVFSRRDITA